VHHQGPASGSERAHGALRFAHWLIEKDWAAELTRFPTPDAVRAAKAQMAPERSDNAGRMLQPVLAGEGRVGTCAVA